MILLETVMNNNRMTGGAVSMTVIVSKDTDMYRHCSIHKNLIVTIFSLYLANRMDGGPW